MLISIISASMTKYIIKPAAVIVSIAVFFVVIALIEGCKNSGNPSPLPSPYSLKTPF